jgi:hypothetical protein
MTARHPRGPLIDRRPPRTPFDTLAGATPLTPAEANCGSLNTVPLKNERAA